MKRRNSLRISALIALCVSVTAFVHQSTRLTNTTLNSGKNKGQQVMANMQKQITHSLMRN